MTVPGALRTKSAVAVNAAALSIIFWFESRKS